jgi:hypothetical protein
MDWTFANPEYHAHRESLDVYAGFFELPYEMNFEPLRMWCHNELKRLVRPEDGRCISESRSG